MGTQVLCELLSEVYPEESGSVLPQKKTVCYLKIYRITHEPLLEIVICKSGYFLPYPWHYNVCALSQLVSNKIP